MTDLNFIWNSEENCDIAEVSDTLRVKAVRDESASNPFDDSEGHYPMLILSDGEIIAGPRRTGYTSESYECPSYGGQPIRGFAISRPIERFCPEGLIFNQVHIAKLLGFKGVKEMLESDTSWDDADLDETPNWINDADILRNAMWSALADLDKSDKLEAIRDLHLMNGIHAYIGTSTGYSQGDQIEVLVVATPEAIETFGVVSPIDDAALQGQVDLYGAWAWGDCYGYVIEKGTRTSYDPEDFDDGEIEWEEIDSCWGYYGTDHAESGLADAAREALPETVDA
jgi:hypothetical protein